ncbi:serine hydrolase [Amycolatopsis sp. NPDC051061]|uniref:serine hydrolase n=1 Tax=Amycolatopsis sp. NPDC051061 TaxID=3155042 RepID=UPI003429EE69
MHRGNAMLLAGTCAGAVAAMLVVAAAVRPPRPAAAAGPELTTAPSYTTSVATTATSAPPETSAKPSAKAVPEGAALAALVPGKVSVLVRDRKSGDVVSYRPDATYTSASLVKLLIAVEALQRGEPAAEVAEMLSRSDDDVASRLWMKLGGPAIVTSWAKRIGMTSTRPPADPTHWGSTLVTATDLARFYAYLMDEAPEGTRQVVLRALDGATEHGADGFDQFFGIPGAVTAADWAVKQGWSCCDPGRDLHTSGLVGGRRYIVVVLSAQPAATSWAKASQNVTAVVKALSGPLGWS